MLPLLYTYRRCPYAMRARMALFHAGVVFDTHEIVLRDKPARLLTVSPKGTVPVLVLPEGHVLEQSLDIVRWAYSHTGDTEGWWARAQTAANLALQQSCDGAFKRYLDRYKYPERFKNAHDIVSHPVSVGVNGSLTECGIVERNNETHSSSQSCVTTSDVSTSDALAPTSNAPVPEPFQSDTQSRDRAVVELLIPLNNRLNHSPQLGGATPCATDICIFPFVRQFAAVDSQWFAALPLPALQNWLAEWLAHPLFERAMRKTARTEPISKA